MADRTELKARLEFRKAALKEARTAYLALLSGQVQSYAIGSRNMTKLDLSELAETVRTLEKEVDELSAVLSGGSRRKAVGIVPCDW